MIKMGITTTRNNGVITHEYTGLKHVAFAAVREVSPNMAHGYTTVSHRGAPDPELAVKEHQERVATVGNSGEIPLPIEVLPARGKPDGNFVRDGAVEDAGTVQLMNPALNDRKLEIGDLLLDLSSIMFDVRPWPGPMTATAEGGDFVYAGKQPAVLNIGGKLQVQWGSRLFDTYLAGVSERTNIEGIRAFKHALNVSRAEKGMDPVQVIPVNVSGVLHLETGLTIARAFPGDSVAFQDPALGQLPKIVHELFRVEVLPPEQGYGASVLPINSTIFTAREHPEAGKKVELHVPAVKNVPLTSEQTSRMDGSLTCDFFLASEGLRTDYINALRI